MSEFQNLGIKKLNIKSRICLDKFEWDFDGFFNLYDKKGSSQMGNHGVLFLYFCENSSLLLI